MNWHDYEIELVTDCLCAGADQQKAEIRVPSIRGQVRWWFRALGGTREEEKELFGGVHDEAKRSAVIMRLAAPLESSVAKNLFELVGRDMNHPQAYLLWPLRPTRTSEQRRGVIPRSEHFCLRWSLRGSSQVSDELGNRLRTAIEAWILLSSIGTRSRRGYGSLCPCGKGMHSLPSLGDFKAKISAILSLSRKHEVSVLALSGPQDSAISALDCLGKWLKQFRAGSKKSVADPWEWGFNDHEAGLRKRTRVYRPAVGLPLTQRYGDGTVVETSMKETNRWSSPVHMKVIRCGNQYYPLAVFFPQMAIKPGTLVTLAPRRGPSWDLPVDHGLFEAMMKPGPGGQVLYPA